MSSAICTLFEGDYHLGLAALANSAWQNGWRGILFAGYRSELPPWARPAQTSSLGSRFHFAEGAAIQFVPLATSVHLTNYKPDFMLDLWNSGASDSESLFYFDPDIVLRCPWTFFEDWARCGVALCEDVNSPVSLNHPRRAMWKRYFAQHGIELRDKTEFYVNGGFVGLARADKSFLRTWQEVQKAMAVDLGGLANANIGGPNVIEPQKRSPTYMFNRTDQDALNAAVMASACQASIMGSEGMDFKPGGYVMSHALGPDKPWRKNYLRAAMRGVRPSMADEFYWSAVERPIRAYPAGLIARRKAAIAFARLIGRSYRRA